MNAAVPALQSLPGAHEKARFWDRIAARYAADPIADLPGYEATLRRVQGLLDARHDVLEIGCGTGSTALRLAPFTRRLLATDISVEMIAIARQRLASQPTPQLSFAVADADAPVSGRGTHDVVMAFNMLHLVGHLDQALMQVWHALRPGGLLISKTACLAEMNPLIPHLAVPLMRAIGKAPAVLCFSQTQLQSAMVRQGLEVVCSERHGTRGKDIRAFVVARKPG
ncbi:methyltransferase domain-containing protein [Acidovorax sp. sic0104]|nr:methyltransferase domain-containing protein [Acidovorax sp. sic0104]